MLFDVAQIFHLRIMMDFILRTPQSNNKHTYIASSFVNISLVTSLISLDLSLLFLVIAS